MAMHTITKMIKRRLGLSFCLVLLIVLDARVSAETVYRERRTNQEGDPLTDVKYYAPVPLWHPETIHRIYIEDDLLDFPYSISARWGYSEDKLIPEHGKISIHKNSIQRLSTDRVTRDTLGLIWLDLVIQDDHALSSTPQYAADNTQVETSAIFNVNTRTKPKMTLTYASGVAADGTSLTGLTYDEYATRNLCGGEDGWTRFPITAKLYRFPWRGSYWMHLGVQRTWISSYASVLEQTIDTHTLSIGARVQGFASPVRDLSETKSLSPWSRATVFLDTVPPVPNVGYDTRTQTFIDMSRDRWSGLSTRKPPRIALTKLYFGEPLDREFVRFEELILPETGMYEVWMKVTDRAGNVVTKRVRMVHVLRGEDLR